MPARPSATIEEILKTTIEVIAERDISGVTVDLVAERVGVSKATIYRRWKSKDDLILAALKAFKIPSTSPDTGSLRGDLTILLEQLVSLINQRDGGKVFSAFLNASVRDKQLEKLRKDTSLEYRSVYERVIKRAVSRGEIDKSTNVRLMIDVLTSPFMYRSIVDHSKAKLSDVENVIDIAVSSFQRKSYRDSSGS
jgi:AcrR family transcriptional regulator